MRALRSVSAMVVIVALSCWGAVAASAAQPDAAVTSREVLREWYKLSLALTRHTPTYSPPVASRSFAYIGLTAFETVASGDSELRSLAGQLNGLTAVPQRDAGQTYDEALTLDTALATTVQDLYSHTGPTGQRALAALTEKLHGELVAGLPDDVVARSEAYGRAVAEHILAYSRDDGGAVVENMGFPTQYPLDKDPAHWKPTSSITQQQAPLLPNWGKNRTFAIPNGATCSLPPPPAYSEDKDSEFYKQAMEVYQVRLNLTPEQKAIGRFWADDAMASVTPPGHWISISLQILERDDVGLARSVEVLARVGIALSDAFVGCWQAKYQYDLVRPVTYLNYIRNVIDSKFEPLLFTPPFPEYPSGHSTQSGAAAVVLTNLFGENFAFRDVTDQFDGLAPREFPSFWAAAQEAAISRMYGGIHFRAALELGLNQGRCIGGYVNALQTRK
ncbi:MAG: phosphatase PAP2 family protein [Bradyrhizobium sp.]|nr:MAG: phosphatase PAP2 family protein [Bradyrhizobium sp.]